ncbi:hypothetical protein COK19_03665 [Bacillus cereus]|nr:NAD-dependent epimerase/dehydratase family protein [Bacillus cereus]PFR30981.1 hypothetical protein COK19_03665 [Bacillus cereus]
MSILVLGGAGYIGSHAVYQLIDQNYDVLVVDNLQTGHEVSSRIGERRSGDPSKLVASAEQIKHVLEWEPKRTSIQRIIKDAWSWHQSHPNGYKN